MEQEFWLNKWQQNDINFNQTKPNKYLQQFIDALNLEKGATLFVPLCGKSIDMLWLREQGYRIIGVELSEKACQDFFIEHGIDFRLSKVQDFQSYEAEGIQLLAGDFFKLTANYLKNAKAVYDRAALIALPAQLRQTYVQHLQSLLNISMPILLITASFNQEEMPGPPFSLSKSDIDKLFSDYFEIRSLYSGEAENIPSHLLKRGLTEAKDKIYLINTKY
ncbi:MAG: thiopurine S-methyltransferase [Proteobacteria bacterium]|nr:thiopurine S-methyltransferase [Pseudomonadota bacterium]